MENTNQPIKVRLNRLFLQHCRTLFLALRRPPRRHTVATSLDSNSADSCAIHNDARGGEQPVGQQNDPTRRGNSDERMVSLLPLSGVRSFDDLALLAAGVAPPPQVRGVAGPGIGAGIGTAGQFSVNGQRARSNNFTVDGSDNNDEDVGVRRQGFVSLVPQSVESVKEIQIVTHLWDAEHGRSAGSQVNAVSKSGTNFFHGAAL